MGSKRFNVGVDDVVKKPGAVRQLVARANAILRRASDVREEAQFGWSLAAFDLTIDDTPVAASAYRERQILEYLAQNRRRRRPSFSTPSTDSSMRMSTRRADRRAHLELRKKLRLCGLATTWIDAKRFAGYAFIGDRLPCEIERPVPRVSAEPAPVLSIVVSNPDMDRLQLRSRSA